MNILHRIWTGIVAAVTGVALSIVAQMVGHTTSGWQIDDLKWLVLAFAGLGFVLGFVIGPRTVVGPAVPSSLTSVAPVVRQANRPVPKITAEELAAKVRAIIPEPVIEITPISPEHGSWNMHVKKGKLDMEFIWGPLSGFGASDLARPTPPDDTPFDLADEGFESVDEALEYLRKLASKYG